jgi:hypothetical protein
MLRVCFFPLPQGGRRDEWAGADRTNGSGNGAAAKKLRIQNPRHRRLPFTALFAAVFSVSVVIFRQFVRAVNHMPLKVVQKSP